MEDLKRIRCGFVHRVPLSSLKGLLDDLWQRKVLSTDDKDTVMEDQMIRADRARCLIDMVIAKGERASLAMIDSILERDRELYLTVGLILPRSPTDRVGFESEYMKGETGRGSGEPSSPPSLEMGSGEECMDSIFEIRCTAPGLSEKQLLEVAQTMGNELLQAAHHLGMKSKDLDDMMADTQTDKAIQKLKILVGWKRQKTGKATAQDLLEDLGNLEDLPDKTRELLTGELPRIRSEFIQRVSTPVLKGLLDDLWLQCVFSTEERDFVMEELRIKEDQARRLVDMVIGKGEKASLLMIDSMKKRDPHLCSTLGLISSPAGVARDNKTRFAGQALTDQELLMVAETLGNGWELFAIHLELKIKDLDNIKAEHRSVAMQKQKMLVLWKRRRPPGEATAQDLLRGLEDLDLPVETRLLLTGGRSPAQ